MQTRILRKTTSVMKFYSLIALASFSFATLTSTAQVADAGPDTTLCVNFYTMQGSSLPPGANGVWTIVSGCGTIVNAGSPTTDLNSLCVGTNVFVWYVDDNGTSTTDQMAITVYDASMAVANAGPDTITVIAPQSSAFLSGSPIPIYPAICWWSWVMGSGVVVDPNDPNTSVGGLTIGGNILLWTCDNGPCGTTSDTLVIQMMMATGISEYENQRMFAYDVNTRMLYLIGAGSLEGMRFSDIHGRVVDLPTTGSTRTWDLSPLPAGIYVVRALIDGKLHGQRLVVGH